MSRRMFHNYLEMVKNLLMLKQASLL